MSTTINGGSGNTMVRGDSANVPGKVFDTRDNVMSFGLEILYMNLELLNDQGNAKFESMRQRSERSRNSQDKANDVDAIMSDMIKDDATKPMSHDVWDYMNKNGIKVGGQTIVNYMNNKNWDGLNKGQFQAIKTALENDANRASDVASQSNLQVSKILQTYNFTVTLLDRIQAMLAEQNKTVASSIR